MASVLEKSENMEAEARAKAEEIINNANAEAERILSEANAQAESVVSEANAQAESVISEANAKAESILNEAAAKAESIVAEAEAKAEELKHTTETAAEDLMASTKDMAAELLVSAKNESDSITMAAKMRLEDILPKLQHMEETYNKIKGNCKVLSEAMKLSMDEHLKNIAPEYEGLLNAEGEHYEVPVIEDIDSVDFTDKTADDILMYFGFKAFDSKAVSDEITALNEESEEGVKISDIEEDAESETAEAKEAPETEAAEEAAEVEESAEAHESDDDWDDLGAAEEISVDTSEEVEAIEETEPEAFEIDEEAVSESLDAEVLVNDEEAVAETIESVDEEDDWQDISGFDLDTSAIVEETEIVESEIEEPQSEVTIVETSEEKEGFEIDDSFDDDWDDLSVDSAESKQAEIEVETTITEAQEETEESEQPTEESYFDNTEDLSESYVQIFNKIRDMKKSAVASLDLENEAIVDAEEAVEDEDYDLGFELDTSIFDDDDLDLDTEDDSWDDLSDAKPSELFAEPDTAEEDVEEKTENIKGFEIDFSIFE